MDANEVKTLTQLRKEISLSTAANVRMIAQLFHKIAEQNPQAVKDAFSSYLKTKPDAMQTTMVEFYSDQAEFIATLFDLD